jgi:hypothetical protein
MQNKVVVSFASFGREAYPQAQLNLIRSCKNAGWDGDFYLRCLDGYCDEYMGEKIQLGSWPYSRQYGICWQHKENPYAFKVFAIQEVFEKGYTQIIWMDSTCRMLQYPEPLLELAKEKGIVAFDNLGHPVAPWVSDNALQFLGETEESLEGVKQIMACCIIFDFTNPITSRVFDRWMDAAINGAFREDETSRPNFKGFRHDQAVLSVLLHQHGIPLLNYGEGFCYHPHEQTLEFGAGPYYLINKGIGL